VDQESPVEFFDPRARPERREKEGPDGRPEFWLALAGFGLLVAGQLLDWGWYVDSMGHRHRLALWAQTSDGFLALVAAVGLVVVLGYRPMASSGYRAAQLLPLVLGATSTLSALTGYLEVMVEADHQAWASQLVGIEPGMWASLAGGVLAGAAGFATTRIWLRNSTHADVTGLASPVEGAFEVVLAGLGAAVGLGAWLLLVGGSQVVETLWLGVVAVLVGPVITLWLWQTARGWRGVGRSGSPDDWIGSPAGCALAVQADPRRS
jgi:hypothetical protein